MLPISPFLGCTEDISSDLTLLLHSWIPGSISISMMIGPTTDRMFIPGSSSSQSRLVRACPFLPSSIAYAILQSLHQNSLHDRVQPHSTSLCLDKWFESPSSADGRILPRSTRQTDSAAYGHTLPITTGVLPNRLSIFTHPIFAEVHCFSLLYHNVCRNCREGCCACGDIHRQQ